MRNCTALLAVLLLFAIGCGSADPAKAKLYSVKGKVTGAKPLTDCAINFVSTSQVGKAFGGKIAADGSYTLSDSDGREGAEPGKYKIVLSPPPDTAMKAMMSGGGGPPKVESPFPDEFKDVNTSPVEKEVKAESNTIDIAIP